MGFSKNLHFEFCAFSWLMLIYIKVRERFLITHSHRSIRQAVVDAVHISPKPATDRDWQSRNRDGDRARGSVGRKAGGGVISARWITDRKQSWHRRTSVTKSSELERGSCGSDAP